MSNLLRVGKPGVLTAAVLLALSSCSPGEPAQVDEENPYLVDEDAKADTGYLNLAGVETEVTLEADIVAPSSRILISPPDLAQFAVTYLRKRTQFYLEILAEDATSPERVEWLVDGSWIAAAQAESMDRSKLKRFRMKKVNAVALNKSAKDLKAGQVIKARVPVKPYSLMTEAGTTCGETGGHIELSQSTYWYLWDPDLSGCKAQMQDLTVTIETVLPNNPQSYPEYDKLWADGKLEVVAVFGKLDDGNDIKKDYNWREADRLVKTLKAARFVEVSNSPLGRRLSRTTGARAVIVDVYYPDLFHNVADSDPEHLANWQTAISEHEVILYSGHSVLGTGSAYDSVTYPDKYQIFFIGGCLGYEYYIRPVLAGKQSWANVDAVASIVENGYNELLPSMNVFLSKLFSGFEKQGNVSWQVIMGAINKSLGHSHFGVSGARDNAFAPGR